MTEKSLGGPRRLPVVVLTALVVAVMGVGLGLYLSRTNAPSAGALPLGPGMTDLGSNTEQDSVVANQGGPHLSFRNVLVQGQRVASARRLVEQEIDEMLHHGWQYLGSVGSDRYGDAILVRPGPPSVVSYAVDRSAQICATLQTASSDPEFMKLVPDRHDRDLLYITLESNEGNFECSLPEDLHTPADHRSDH